MIIEPQTYRLQPLLLTIEKSFAKQFSFSDYGGIHNEERGATIETVADLAD
jgi:hypothetical protein